MKLRKYGFDFDGVLHKYVTKVENSGKDWGQRHPMEVWNVEKLVENKFEKTIKKIERLLRRGMKIWIITARENSNKNYVCLMEFLILVLPGYDAGFLKDKIDIRFEKNKCKVIREVGITHFYDDSCNVLRGVYEDCFKGLKLFLVVPEKNLYVILDGGNIKYVYSYDRYVRLLDLKWYNIKVLSYNISWEAVEGVDSKGVKGSVCKDGNGEVSVDRECKSKNVNACFRNIIRIIFTGNYSIMCLQEVTCVKDIEGVVNSKSHNYVIGKSGKEYIMTIFDVRFSVKKIVHGEFSVGRPILVVFFEQGLCIINMHASHGNGFKKLFEVLGKEVVEEMREYCVMIVGDSNMNVNGYGRLLGGFFNKFLDDDWVFWNSNLSEKVVKSCCSRYLNGKDYVVGFDVMFFRNRWGILKVRKGLRVPGGNYEKSSDHLPIVGEFKYYF